MMDGGRPLRRGAGRAGRESRGKHDVLVERNGHRSAAERQSVRSTVEDSDQDGR
jgi:hypothetical protein